MGGKSWPENISPEASRWTIIKARDDSNGDVPTEDEKDAATQAEPPSDGVFASWIPDRAAESGGGLKAPDGSASLSAIRTLPAANTRNAGLNMAPLRVIFSFIAVSTNVF